VVASGRLALAVRAVGDECAPERPDRRQRRDQSRDDVERYDERERAAASSSSKSGTSEVS
jgi:hypothetical protein